MPDLFTKPIDVVPFLQDRAIVALASKHGKYLDASLTKANVVDLQRRLKDNLEAQKLLGLGRPYFRLPIGQATAEEPISSSAWNEAQERVYIDLYSLYKSLAATQNQDLYVGALSREKFLQTRAAILKIINEVRLYQFLRGNPEFQDAKFIDFHGAINETERPPRAVVDADVRLLELPPRTRTIQSRANASPNARDLKSTKVDIQVLGATAGGLYEAFSPDRMLDANPESFWADMAMAEGPVAQTYAPSGDGGLGTTVETEGVLVHVTLTFSHVGIANNLKILPFGKYPVRVIDVAYKESVGQDQWLMLPNFRVDAPTTDWVEINFDPKTVAQVRITLEQTNYELVTYHLPEPLVRNAILWQQIGATELDDAVYQVQISARQAGPLEISPSQLARLQIVDDFATALETKDLEYARHRQYDVTSTLARAASKAVSKIKPDAANDILFPAFGEKEQDTQPVLAIRKYEYLYGVRSIELNYITYEPVAYYASAKFTSDATVLNASLTVEERHPVFNDGLGDYYRTSTEYDIELGKDRRYPIAPKTWYRDNDLVVPDEYIQFDRVTRTATTRLPIADLATVLRKNGERVQATKYAVSILEVDDPNITNAGIISDLNRFVTPTNTRVGRGLLTFLDAAEFDPNAVYTLQYVAAPGADELDIDGEINSTELVDPEVFEGTNRDHALVLSRFPYVDYNIINSLKWTRDDEEIARWRFVPTLPNYKTGTIGTTINTPNLVGVGTAWATGVDMTETNAFRIKGASTIYKMQAVGNNTNATLAANYKGATLTGQDYVIGQYFESDGKFYCFENMVYEPVRVYVNNVKAYNLTNYETFENPAFSDIPRAGRQLQFIHAGNILYFNTPIENARIEVFYSWLTEYVRVAATLRCNLPANTVLTPQVNQLRVELKTSKL